ncbi:MAG: sugar MFS transporter [Polyangia bacterium]
MRIASIGPSTQAPPGAGHDDPGLRGFVFTLFFVFGGITSLNDILIPKLKGLFTLSNAEVLLVQSAFFAAYLLMSLPAAGLVRRFGYMRTAVIGLVTMTVGCLLFVPATELRTFPGFLGALFVLASGITIVQVVANPLISLLGPPKSASSRLTFAQAFNSLGTTTLPYVGSVLILGATVSVTRISSTYVGLALALVVVATAVWSRRNRLVETVGKEEMSVRGALGLLARGRFAMGAIGIFVYVGAEVVVGSLMVLYLKQHDVFGIDEESAGKLLPYYWGGMMLGRFAGSALLRRFKPGHVLTGAGALALLLLLRSGTATGSIAGWSILAVGLANSIMFPTIFTLACEGLGPRTAEGSGLLCVSIVGGAILPPLAGLVADHFSLRAALMVPAACYTFILVYGIYALRPVASLGDPTVSTEYPVLEPR